MEVGEVDLEAARSAKNVEVQVYMLDALARLALADDDRSSARLLLTEANQLATHISHLLDQNDRFDSNQALTKFD